MTAAELLKFLRATLPYWPFLPLLVLARYVIKSSIKAWQNNRASDIRAIPSPPHPFWRRYIIGHRIIFTLIIGDAFEAAALLNEWRKSLGPIFQVRGFFGERFVWVSSESSIRTINITKSAIFAKPRAVRKLLSALVGANGILLAEGRQHALIRKAVAPALHYDAITAVGDTILKQGKILGERCADLGDSGGDVLHIVRRSTFAVIFETCFGKNAVPQETLDKLEEAYLTAFLEPPRHILRRVFLQLLFGFIIRDEYLTYRPDLKAYIRKTIFDLCEEIVKQGEKGELKNQTRLLSLMVDEETRQKIGKQEMVETVLSFLVAGQVTSSMALCWIMYLVAREPQWQERLVDEMKAWTEEDGLDGLDQLPVLDRVVRESLRLYPAAFTIGRVNTKEVELDGYRIPKGTQLRMPVLAVQRNEEIWGRDANEFNPDRFLREGELARTRMFWMLFAFGTRGCIGQRFAILELKAFLTQVLKRQEIYIKPLEDPAPTCSGAFATPRGMKLYFRERQQAPREIRTENDEV